jgi:uncharacterized membrane protein YedE/YeeE
MKRDWNSIRFIVAAGVVGVIFGAGLIVSGMTNANKVIDFLNPFGGAWDPSLGLVMAGAIAVHMAAFRFITSRPSPLFDGKFHLPTRSDIDVRLLAGAALFGVGWGLGGICPGPGLVAAVSMTSSVLLFVGGLVVGMALFHRFNKA